MSDAQNRPDSTGKKVAKGIALSGAAAGGGCVGSIVLTVVIVAVGFAIIAALFWGFWAAVGWSERHPHVQSCEEQAEYIRTQPPATDSVAAVGTTMKELVDAYLLTLDGTAMREPMPAHRPTECGCELQPGQKTTMAVVVKGQTRPLEELDAVAADILRPQGYTIVSTGKGWAEYARTPEPDHWTKWRNVQRDVVVDVFVGPDAVRLVAFNTECHGYEPGKPVELTPAWWSELEEVEEMGDYFGTSSPEQQPAPEGQPVLTDSR